MEKNMDATEIEAEVDPRDKAGAPMRLQVAVNALHSFGTTEDIEAAAKAVGRIAAKAMVRR